MTTGAAILAALVLTQTPAVDGGTVWIVDAPVRCGATELPPGVFYDRPAFDALNARDTKIQTDLNSCSSALRDCRDASGPWGYVVALVVGLSIGAVVTWAVSKTK